MLGNFWKNQYVLFLCFSNILFSFMWSSFVCLELALPIIMLPPLNPAASMLGCPPWNVRSTKWLNRSLWSGQPCPSGSSYLQGKESCAQVILFFMIVYGNLFWGFAYITSCLIYKQDKKSIKLIARGESLVLMAYSSFLGEQGSIIPLIWGL